MQNNKDVTEKEKLGEMYRIGREMIPSEDYEKDHISQQELADRNKDVTKFLIGKIERGDANPTLEKLIIHAKAINKKTFAIGDVEINVDKFINEIKIDKENKKE